MSWRRGVEAAGPREEKQCWKISEKFPENLNFVQEAERRTSCFPKGVSKGGRVGERVSGWGSGGNNTHPRLRGMARWPGQPSSSRPQSPPVWKGRRDVPNVSSVGQSWQAENVGQRAEVACDHHWLFTTLLMGSSAFLGLRWPRAGRPCNLNRAG